MSQWRELPTKDVELRGQRFRVRVAGNFPSEPFNEPASGVKPDVIQIIDIELLSDEFPAPRPEAIAASLGIPIREFLEGPATRVASTSPCPLTLSPVFLILSPAKRVTPRVGLSSAAHGHSADSRL